MKWTFGIQLPFGNLETANLLLISHVILWTHNFVIWIQIQKFLRKKFKLLKNKFPLCVTCFNHVLIPLSHILFLRIQFLFWFPTLWNNGVICNSTCNKVSYMDKRTQWIMWKGFLWLHPCTTFDSICTNHLSWLLQIDFILNSTLWAHFSPFLKLPHHFPLRDFKCIP